MKKLLLIPLLLVAGFSCKAQTLFFDKLNGSVWSTSSGVEEQPIGLLEDHFENTLHKDNEHIWTFEDGKLTIERYDSFVGIWRIVGSYSYEADKTHGILTISNENEKFAFKVGIISTGAAAYLQPVKERENR